MNLQIASGHTGGLTLAFSQVALLPVFPVFQEEVHTVPVKLPLETCAARVVCLRQPRSGENGTKRSTWDRSTFGRRILPENGNADILADASLPFQL